MSSEYPSIFSKGFTKHGGIEYKEVEKVANKIFHGGTTETRYIDTQSWEMYGRPATRLPGQVHAERHFAESFGMRAVVTRYGMMDSIPKEDIKEDLAGILHRIIPARGGAMGRAFAVNEEIVCANFFANLGYTGTTGLATVDGSPLFYSAHPTSKNISTTLANRPTSEVDISIAAIDAARTNLMMQKAANGVDRMANRPKLLVVNPAQTRIAKQVVNAPWERATGDRNMNVIPDYKISLLEWPYFEKSGATGTNNAWFIQGETHHCYKDTLEAFTTDSDSDIVARSIVVIADHAFVVYHTDWRGFYGSVGV